jgi:anti-sigma factor RsiW
MNAPITVTETELQAWVDGQLAPARRAAVDDYLAQHPEQQARLLAYRAQNAALRDRFNPVLDEAVPPALLQSPLAAGRNAANDRWRQPALLPRAAAMLLLTVASGAMGWWLHDALPAAASETPWQGSRALGNLPQRAAVAHVVYTPEVKHPVEVGADQEQHLVAWLSKRLGAPLHAPQLGALGYELVGGRLLPGQSGPVAQFMYHDASGARLTLYVSTEQTTNHATGFRFAQEGEVAVFYWIDGKFGYALSGQLPKAALGKIADAVYAQLQPGA